MTTILGIDVGGTNVKIRLSNRDEIRKIPSGPAIRARVDLARAFRQLKRLGFLRSFDAVELYGRLPHRGGTIGAARAPGPSRLLTPNDRWEIATPRHWRRTLNAFLRVPRRVAGQLTPAAALLLPSR